MAIINYGTENRQIIKSYCIPSLPPSTIIIFIHGGAWRDPNNSCNDTDKMAKFIESFGTHKQSKDNLFSIDYRLCPIQFPSFLVDVVGAILKIQQYFGEAEKIVLSGHSVGATLALQFCEYSNVLKSWSEIEENGKLSSLTASIESLKNVDTIKELLSIVQFHSSYLHPTLVLLDGIYNLEALVEEYPSYESFVLEANGSRPVYLQSTKFDFSELNSVTLVHSTRDELLSLQQTQWLEKRLRKVGVLESVIIEDFGEHNNVYVNERVARLLFDRCFS